jgi:hypothetical protein
MKKPKTKINGVRIDRLQKLYAHMRKPQKELFAEKFDYEKYVATTTGGEFNPIAIIKNKCGTSACMLGEAALLDTRNWEFDSCDSPVLKKMGHRNASMDCASKYYGITTLAAHHLFMPEEQVTKLFGGRDLHGASRKESVVNNLKIFIQRVKAGKITSETDFN